MPEIDLFHLYRRALALVCGLYTLVQTIRALFYWLAPDSAEHPREGFFRRYVLTHVLRAKLGMFVADLLQIGVLLAGLVSVILLHSR